MPPKTTKSNCAVGKFILHKLPSLSRYIQIPAKTRDNDPIYYVYRPVIDQRPTVHDVDPLINIKPVQKGEINSKKSVENSGVETGTKLATFSRKDDKINTEQTPFPNEDNDAIMEDRKITKIIDTSTVPAPPTLETNPYAILAIDETSIDSIGMDIEDLNDVENSPITEQSMIANFDKDSAKLATSSSKTDGLIDAISSVSKAFETLSFQMIINHPMLRPRINILIKQINI